MQDDERELYEFTWPGKNAAKLEAGRSTRKTLRPCIEDSRNFDTTENLYIEGDNLEALKILQRSYLRKVKMIYIDPPYNTGNDFIYHDDFREEQSQHEEHYGLYDEDGNRNFSKQNYVVNTKSNPRFHSEWCNMIYPRLKLARNLLSLDGVIFISIDDNEQPALRMICNEIFGANNFIAQLVWERAYAPKNDAKYISISHDYILMYAKYLDAFKIGRLPRTDKANARYTNPDNDPRGVWKSGNLLAKTYSKNYVYPIVTPSGRIVEPPPGRCWRLSRESFQQRVNDNRIWFGVDGDGIPRNKTFLTELKFDGMSPTSILFYRDVGHSQEGTKELAELLGGLYFDGPKPIRLLQHLMTLANIDKNSIVLDFFSGSATTAHAVMNLNARDGGHRKFIMVQLPEKFSPDSKAAMSHYKTICDIGRARIKLAGDKLTEGDDLHLADENLPDIGFRTFRVDSANMRENVYLTVDEMLSEGMSFESLTDNIKPDRNDMDLLFECVRDLKLPLSLKYSCEEFQGVTIHHYNKPELAACFGKNLTPEVMRYIAESGAKYVYFRDWCFEDIKAKVNLTQIFELYGEESKMRIL